MNKRQLSDDDEKQIRKAFFKEGVSGEALMKQWKIKDGMLRRVLGGPISKRNKGIEAFYG